MPAGLDGHPDPIRSPARDHVIATVAERVVRRPEARVLVAIDGRPSSGKSTLGDELASALRGRGMAVVRSTTDSFHRPRSERLRQGASSAEGYVHDSHQLDRITHELIEPFRDGAPDVLTAAFDEPSDTPIETRETVAERSVLVFDGLFVHRPELAPYWTVSVLLEADRRCDAAWLDYLLGGLPDDPTERARELDARLARARWPRYRDGWRLYVDTARPADRATCVIDNDDVSEPRVANADPSCQQM